MTLRPRLRIGYVLISSASCDGVAADSLDWFKIQEDIFGADGLWATEVLPSKLKWEFRIPSDLAPGYVLTSSILKTELTRQSLPHQTRASHHARTHRSPSLSRLHSGQP
jgi:hypothetical protein